MLPNLTDVCINRMCARDILEMFLAYPQVQSLHYIEKLIQSVNSTETLTLMREQADNVGPSILGACERSNRRKLRTLTVHWNAFSNPIVHTLMRSNNHTLETLRLVYWNGSRIGADIDPLSERGSTFPGVDSLEVDVCFLNEQAQWLNMSANRKRLHVFSFDHHLRCCDWLEHGFVDDSLQGTRCLSVDVGLGPLQDENTLYNFQRMLEVLARGNSLERLCVWYWLPNDCNDPHELTISSQQIQSLTENLSVLPNRCLQFVVLCRSPFQPMPPIRTVNDRWGYHTDPFFTANVEQQWPAQRFVKLYAGLLFRLRVREPTDIEVRVVPEGMHVRHNEPYGFDVDWVEFLRDHRDAMTSESACRDVFEALERLWNTGVDNGRPMEAHATVNVAYLDVDSIPFPLNLCNDDFLSVTDNCIPVVPRSDHPREVDDLWWIAELLNTNGGHVPRYHTKDRWTTEHIQTLDRTRFASVLETADWVPFLQHEAKDTLLKLLGGYMAQDFVPHDDVDDAMQQSEIDRDNQFLKSDIDPGFTRAVHEGIQFHRVV